MTIAIPSRWRVCIDFGTAASKASLCATGARGQEAFDQIHPLRIGAAVNPNNAFVAPSALLFDQQRIYFGAAALARADSADTEPLQSFKTFLGARDLNESLDYRLRRTIDASTSFTQRDAIVLYTAYLMGLTDAAIEGDPSLPVEAALCPRRYAYPNWRPGNLANQVVAGIFDVAASVRAQLGEAMTTTDGVDYAAARAALDRAYAQPSAGRIETGIFEAQAAAECHFALSADMPDFVIVFDMGAGTTDMTAFEIQNEAGGRVMREIDQVRQTSALACDEVDKIIVARLVSKAKTEKKRGARKRFWRQISWRARALKEKLFRDGHCEAAYEGSRLVLKLPELLHDPHFQAFHAALLDTYRGFLTEIGIRAASSGRDTIGVVLAGGGSALPFVQQMALKTRPKVSRIRRVLVQPVVPNWVYDHEYARSLAPIFPQIAISIGGAVATLSALERAA